MQLHAVLVGNVHPAGRLDVVHTHNAARIRIAVRCMVDGASTQLLGRLVRQVPLVAGVEHAERVHRAAADREQCALGARALRVNVVQTGTAFVVAGQHHAHAQAGALVLVRNVGHDLGRRRHGNALLVAQLVQATLLGQHSVPVHAIGRTAGQCAQQVVVDFYDLNAFV